MDTVTHSPTPSSPTSLLVCALRLDGRGDIYGGREVMKRVQRLMSHVKVTFTILTPRLGAVESLLFNKEDFVDLSLIRKLESWEIAEESAVLAAIDIYERIIVFPTYHDGCLPFEILSRNKDVIKLRELSAGAPTPGAVNGPTYTLGLASERGELGVLLPLEYYQNLPPLKERNSLEKLSYLKDIDSLISKTILGEEFSEEAILKFSTSSKLYLAYFYEPAVFFCYVNALLRCKAGNLVICGAKEKAPQELVDKIKKTLWNSGFGKIRVVEFSDLNQPKVIIDQKFQTAEVRQKRCTLIFRSLSQSEMEIMLNATEDESLVTGDLSPFQFMAHRKIIAYDARTHKHEAALAMISLAARFDLRFKNLLSHAFFGAPYPINVVSTSTLEEGIMDLFKAVEKDPSLKAHWNQFIEEVFTRHDFMPQLAQILKERMPTEEKNPLLAGPKED